MISLIRAWMLDGSAGSYEQAITDVARKVHHYFGNDRRRCPKRENYLKAPRPRKQKRKKQKK